MNKKYLLSFVVLSLIIGVYAPAFAEEGENRGGPKMYMMGTSTKPRGPMQDMRMIRPEAVGKVSSISGTTLTVIGKAPEKGAATTTYTVDASSAVIVKGGATTTLSEVAVGDLVIVQGTLNGTNITAKLVRDAMSRNPKALQKPGGVKDIQGTGEPIIGGLVSSVSGTTLVVAPRGASSTSYTVNAANARILIRGKQASTTADIMVGDQVIIQGAISGTSVTASSVIDQGKLGEKPKGDAKNGNNGKGDDKGNKGEKGKGFFGGIGGFFKRLFGF